jgi:alpha-tubulin suppressor-like RCC1 family protein
VLIFWPGKQRVVATKENALTPLARDVGEARMKHIANKFFTDIRCGGYHTIALTSKAKVYAWGKNKCVCSRVFAPVFCVGQHSVSPSRIISPSLTHHLRYGQLGIDSLENSYVPTLISKLQLLNVNVISAGYHHSICITGDGDACVSMRARVSVVADLLQSKLRILHVAVFAHMQLT